MEAQERLHADDEVRCSGKKEATKEVSRPRDYAYEALAEVTATHPDEGRGQLNAALKSIRTQSEIEDSYLLSDEIHERAKMYRALFPDVALTPTALAKHWERVYAETQRRPKLGPPPELPTSRREENLAAARELMETLWPKR